MDQLEKNIAGTRRHANDLVDRYFNTKYVIEGNGFARIPTEEREAVRFIVLKRLAQKPTAFYRKLNWFTRYKAAEQMVNTVIRHYPRYAHRFHEQARAHELDYFPEALPTMRESHDLPFKAVGLVQWYENQVKALHEHLDKKRNEMEKKNDPDKLVRLHDEYAKHLHFVESAIAFLEKHEAIFRKHKNAWSIQLDCDKNEGSPFDFFGTYTAFNSVLRFGKSPQYPPLPGSWLYHSPEGHAMHDLQNLEDFVGPWRCDPETVDALFTHRLTTLRQYRLGLSSFLDWTTRRMRELKAGGERGSETQPLDPIHAVKKLRWFKE